MLQAPLMDPQIGYHSIRAVFILSPIKTRICALVLDEKGTW